MSLEIVEVLSVITVLQLILLSILILSHKKGRKYSNKILAAFLFSSALPIIEYILWRFRVEIYPQFPHIFYVAYMFVFLWGPLIFLYTKSLITAGFTFKRKDLIHFIPFLMFVFYMIFDFHLQSTAIKRELLSGQGALVIWEKRIINAFLHLQILFYLILSLRAVKNYGNKIKNFHSDIERVKLNWLNFILIGFICIWSVDLAYFVLWGTKYSYFGEILDYLSLSITFIFACIIVYKGLNFPEIFSGIDIRPKYERSTLTESDAESYLMKLKNLMKEEKPYLDPFLNINQLARKLNMQPRHLSQILNEYLHQKFYDFVNSYRIEEAKKMLLDSSNEKTTVLEVLLDAGFNSKSAFNNAFKKCTGVTPSEFRKINRS